MNFIAICGPRLDSTHGKNALMNYGPEQNGQTVIIFDSMPKTIFKSQYSNIIFADSVVSANICVENNPKIMGVRVERGTEVSNRFFSEVLTLEG